MSSSRRHSASDKPRLRMDSYSGSAKSSMRSRASPPKRRELDNVMKKARREGPDKSGYWNKKLLEVEEKDPNRWRHSGFKELYGGKGSRSRTRSRSMTRSPRPKSPVGRPKSPPPIPRSPSPLRKSNKVVRKTDSAKSRSRPNRPKSPLLSRRPNSLKPSSRRPITPPKRRSESLSSGSVSSCSDESCSVCSPKNKTRDREAKEKNRERPRPRAVNSPRPGFRGRSRSFSVPRSKPSVIEKPRRKKDKQRKREKDKNPLKTTRRRPIKVESESDRSSSPSPGPRLTLSERFGKIAQWSCDRDFEHRNLKITAGDHMTVEMDNPPSPPYEGSLSSFPEGAWDDVRVRYTYYKEQGYLRNLTLQDYIKWEQWWYKYQDWLNNERYMSRRWM
uniref:Uncharacterized protein n=1 Tax=Clastoptera arizonana TaxID=38151 RepID=A0A1B6DTE6_9HEMI